MNSRKQRILVVDDSINNLQVIGAILQPEYEVLIALNGAKALRIAESVPQPDLVLLDVKMPDMDGITLCRQLKSRETTQGIPVIFVSASSDELDENLGMSVGGADFVSKPIHAALLRARVKTHLLVGHQKRLLAEVEQAEDSDHGQVLRASLLSISSLAESRDRSIGNHLQKTSEYMKTMSRVLKSRPGNPQELSEGSCSALPQAALLHDTGKVVVPDDILLKPGRLTKDEFAVVQTHARIGADAILESARNLKDGGERSFFRTAADLALTHHERWDGQGYPEGLTGGAIPLCGRIMAICDVYDALISRRVYKAPVPHDEACDIIRGERGRQFDPDLVDIFLDLEETFLQIAWAFSVPGEERDSLLQATMKRGLQ